MPNLFISSEKRPVSSTKYLETDPMLNTFLTIAYYPDCHLTPLAVACQSNFVVLYLLSHILLRFGSKFVKLAEAVAIDDFLKLAVVVVTKFTVVIQDH